MCTRSDIGVSLSRALHLAHTVLTIAAAMLLVTGLCCSAVADPPLSGLQFWLDGQDLNADGVPDGLTPGTGISLWKDKVGELQFSQSVAIRRPSVSSINNVQAVEFVSGGGNTGDVLAELDPSRVSSATFLTDSSGTVVVVHDLNVSQGGGAGEGVILAAWTGPREPAPGAFGFNVAVQDVGWFSSTGGIKLQNSLTTYVSRGGKEGGPNTLGTGPRWTSISSNGSTDWTWTSNGAGNQPENFLTGTNTEGGWYDDNVAPYQALSVGAESYGEPDGVNGYLGLNGKIGEILIYDHVLSSSELFGLGTYINAKYGLPNEAGVGGDFDGDGDVDGEDFLKWQRGETLNPLSQLELADWESAYGFQEPPGMLSPLAVPEPGSWPALIMALLCSFAPRKRK